MHREYPRRYESGKRMEQQPAFREVILDSLASEPIEDGVLHPAESFLERAWDECADSTRSWIDGVISGSSSARASRAALLRLVARTCPASAIRWGRTLAIRALADADSDVREAAVRSLESWGGSESRTALQSHHDPLAWLARYTAQALAYLS